MPDHAACPLPKTHRRLADVYVIWHETLASYPDPEPFRRKLNTLLQETRNITWMLQAEKHVMPDFDAWYAQWRLTIAGVDVLKWAQQMRNQVVKKGDLETRSIARVSVLAVWDNPPATEIAVPPMAGPAMIAQLLTATGLPKQLLKDAVAVVERRWIVDSLPDREVLDALAECYSVLHELVRDGHDRLGVTMANDSFELRRPTWSEDRTYSGRPAGMVLAQEMRTARLKLATREWLTFDRKFRPITDREIEAVQDRYGPLPQAREIPSTAQELFSQAEMIFEVAKRMLSHDKTHGFFAWLFGPEGVDSHVLQPEDRADKYVMWNKLADDVRRRKDWGLITVGEVWTFKGDFRALNVDPWTLRGIEDMPGHGEALQVAAGFHDGQTRMYAVEFTRDESENIVFGAQSVGYSPEAQPQFLVPVLKVWQEWRKRDSGKEDQPLTISSRPRVGP